MLHNPFLHMFIHGSFSAQLPGVTDISVIEVYTDILERTVHFRKIGLLLCDLGDGCRKLKYLKIMSLKEERNLSCPPG